MSVVVAPLELYFKRLLPRVHKAVASFTVGLANGAPKKIRSSAGRRLHRMSRGPVQGLFFDIFRRKPNF